MQVTLTKIGSLFQALPMLLTLLITSYVLPDTFYVVLEEQDVMIGQRVNPTDHVLLSIQYQPYW
jgi:hypothetical protein